MLLIVALSVALITELPEIEVRFNQHIRPILAENCLHCHGPDANTREANLRLDIEEAAKLDAIDIRRPEQSKLLQRIDAHDPDQIMPPGSTGKSLSAEQKHLLRAWVQQGAKFEGHWAYEPIRAPKLPVLDSQESSAIDGFLLERLIPQGLGFAPPVSREQLIRRASFDLVGLPPTWQEVQAFVEDENPNAFAKCIDRLLDSPRYGERWGRLWLDLARYADTHGGAAIGFTTFPFSYTYRDYVIQAFNADVPYDQFLKEQLAADQLGLAKNEPRLAALGFLTVGMQFRNRNDTIDDQIDVITRGLMGLTVSCARCHDHKFDSISTQDYYSLYAAIAPSASPPELPVIGGVADKKAHEEYQTQLRNLQTHLDDFVRDQCEIMRSRLRMQAGLYLREIAKGAPEQDVSTSFLSYRTDDIRPLVLNRWRDYLSSIDDVEPVLGPWVQLHRIAESSTTSFQSRAMDVIAELKKQLNDSGWKPDKQHALSGTPPRWNPLVLDALLERQPTSMIDVADVYGKIFADANSKWLLATHAAALEGVSEESVKPDESADHQVINSPVYRQIRRHLFAKGSPFQVPDEIAASLTNRTISDQIGGKRGAIHQLHLSSPGSPPRAMILAEDPQPKDFFVFLRGNPVTRGQRVDPGFLTALGDKKQSFDSGQRRLALADSMVAPDNPLTRRVLVNWVWQHHFGKGIVRTPDDFGTRGSPPTHPELLDYLATDFSKSGWSIKQLHRSIMLSRAYQQGAIENEDARIKDPDNTLVWRMNRRRLDFESMRDALLAVTGELDSSMGGRPIDLTATPVVPRRSVYGFVNRDIVSALMSTFDGANPNSCTSKRPETTVPQQTLFALNSNFIQDRAARLVERIKSQQSSTAAQSVERLYQLALSRQPQAQELERALEYVHEGDKNGSTPSFDSRWIQLAHALLASNEFVFLD
jgi:hypothetical protein